MRIHNLLDLMLGNVMCQCYCNKQENNLVSEVYFHELKYYSINMF